MPDTPNSRDRASLLRVISAAVLLILTSLVFAMLALPAVAAEEPLETTTATATSRTATATETTTIPDPTAPEAKSPNVTTAAAGGIAVILGESPGVFPADRSGGGPLVPALALFSLGLLVAGAAILGRSCLDNRPNPVIVDQIDPKPPEVKSAIEKR